MIYLAQGGYLLLILLIPLMFIAYWLMRRIRRRRIARFGDPELVARLTPEVPRRKGWAKLTLLSIAMFFLAIGMARPQIGATLKERQIKGAEIMVVLDVSNSMLAEDYSPNPRTIRPTAWSGPNWPSRNWWTSCRATVSA